MKKFKWLLVLLLLPVVVRAEDNNEIVDNGYYFQAGSVVNSSKDVNGSTLLAGDNVAFTNVTKGAGLLFGSNVSYNGEAEYGVIAGQNVKVSGKVLNDLAVFGKTITFDKFTGGRDAFVSGSSITVNGDINRNLVIYADTVVINGTNVNDLKIEARVIEIKEGNISKLSYNEDAEITISNNAKITEKVLLEAKNQSAGDTVMGYLLTYANVIVIFAALALIVPGLFNKINKQYENATPFSLASTMGFGALALISVPIIGPILVLTRIGALTGAALLVLYVISMVVSTLLVGYLIGMLLWKKIVKKDINVLLAGLLGVSIVYVLTLIPYVTIFTVLISILLGLGMVLNLFKKTN